MIQEIFPGVYVVGIETEMVDVRHLNYGFLRGAVGEHSVLIDCGSPEKADPSYGTALREVMRTLGFHPDDLDVLIMHGRKDHLGQARALAAEGARISVDPEGMDQSAILNTLLMDGAERRQLFHLVSLKTYGRETYEASWQAADCSSEGYEGVWDFPYSSIRPGDYRRVSDYRLEVAALPGYTHGELGFFARAQKFIFSGDHILEEVTPIISSVGEFLNALSSYITSLDEATVRFSDYLFVPGHDAPFRNPRTTVKKIIRYRHRHCENLYHVIRTAEEPLLLRDIGAMVYRHHQGPLTEKERGVCIQIWFEACACLKYLEEQEALREGIKEGASYWQSLQ